MVALSNDFLNKYDVLFDFTGQGLEQIEDLKERAIEMTKEDFLASVEKLEGFQENIENLENFYADVKSSIN